MHSDASNADRRESPAFLTTHWTVVLEAARPGAEASDAFAQLYQDYWYPLYAYVRRRGHTPEEAEDITQGFFARVLEKHSLASIQRDGGKFRSFLLAGLVNFLANEWDRTQAQKRGGGQKTIPLEVENGEARYVHEPADQVTPESLFERHWAFTLLEHVTQRLQTECVREGKSAFFNDVRVHLQGDRQGPSHADVATRHGMSEGSVKVAVHRLRQRYGRLLREEIARTVSRPDEVDAELRYLIGVVGR
ncbi:MAG TPA: sigma-70 family RNA polymerase sigma factor [Verrucomicrobiota bacterium]|nr:RNA polymerase subunit sigma-24 [Verrucomicrobiales bacterium]HRI14916.1 sigma-70 family RNA polymerase sigma factor [Verrucomicrobiota bacterium]